MVFYVLSTYFTVRQCSSYFYWLVVPIVFVGLYFWVRICMRPLGGNPPLRLPPSLPTGFAALYPLRWVYRNDDEWWGGLKAIEYDTSQTSLCKPLRAFLDGGLNGGHDAHEEVKASDAISSSSVSSFAIYCLDFYTKSVVFMEMKGNTSVLEEPFLDRGVRHCAGKYVLVASFETVEAYIQEKQMRNKLKRSQKQNPNGGSKKDVILWVWNTGRCGSTLIHRLLLACNFCSLSEPYWAEQLCRARAQKLIDDSSIRRLLRICLFTDAHLLCRAGNCQPSSMKPLSPYRPHSIPHVLSLNLKGSGHYLLDLALAEFPSSSYITSRHLFLYRDVAPVVESLASVFYTASSPSIQACLLLRPRWTLGLITPYRSSKLQKWVESGVLEVNAFGSMGRWAVARDLALAWLDSICTWLEVIEDKQQMQESRKEMSLHHISKGDHAVLKMEDLVDPARREEVVGYLLSFATDIAVNKLKELRWMSSKKWRAVFDRHSQQGNRMQMSSNVTGRRFLTSAGQTRLHSLLDSVPDQRVQKLRLSHYLLGSPQK